MKKIIKWTAVFAVMFCVSTLLSMWSGNDVSWAAFAGGQWGVGALFAPLLTAIVYLFPGWRTLLICDCCCCQHCCKHNLEELFRDDDYYYYYRDDN